MKGKKKIIETGKKERYLVSLDIPEHLGIPTDKDLKSVLKNIKKLLNGECNIVVIPYPISVTKME